MKRVMYIVIILIGVFFFLEIYIRYFTNYNEPAFDKKTRIVKRKPGNEGVYMVGSSKTGYFKINNEGWNSFRDYYKEKTPGKKRIAVVGHSNVEGLRVHPSQLFTKILEEELMNKNNHIEVYTFGYGGMHLAQALYVSRFVVKEYKPDILLIGTLLDDFLYEVTDKKYFLSIKIDDNGEIEEMNPERFAVFDQYKSPLSFLYFSKAVMYSDIKFGFGEKKFKQQQTIDLTDSTYYQKQKLAIGYVCREFKELAENNNIQILFIDFPVSFPSYNRSANFELNQYDSIFNKTKKLLQEYSFPLINIESAFKKDYLKNEINFDFKGDMHYNEHAHQVIGKALAESLIENK